MSEHSRDDAVRRITEYLSGGGLFNPELANHSAVRDLLIDCRDALLSASAAPSSTDKLERNPVHYQRDVKLLQERIDQLERELARALHDLDVLGEILPHDEAAQSASGALPDDLLRTIRTLVEDFKNPCFGSAIHNDIPRTIGMVVLQHYAATDSTSDREGE